MKLKRTLLVPLLLLAGCATDPVKIREPWYGATYDDLVARWGKPTGSGKSEDGSEMHTWRSEVASAYQQYPTGPSVGFGIFGSSRGGSGASVGIGVPIGGPAAPPAPSVCERRMIFRDARVADQVWNGDPSYCETFKR